MAVTNGSERKTETKKLKRLLLVNRNRFSYRKKLETGEILLSLKPKPKTVQRCIFIINGDKSYFIYYSKNQNLTKPNISKLSLSNNNKANIWDF